MEKDVQVLYKRSKHTAIVLNCEDKLVTLYKYHRMETKRLIQLPSEKVIIS